MVVGAFTHLSCQNIGGAAAEFHSLLNGEETVGFTVMQVERKLDSGPIIAQGSISILNDITLHGLIKRNNTAALDVIRAAVEALVTDKVKTVPQDASKSSYYSWPTPQQTHTFLQKGLRFISLYEAVSYIFR